jgi:hypothetical protein
LVLHPQDELTKAMALKRGHSTVEKVDTFLSDEAQKNLDRAVFNHLGGIFNCTPESMPQPSRDQKLQILRVVVGLTDTEDHLNTAYAKPGNPALGQLSEKYPELLEEVQKAWVGGTFKELIRLGMLLTGCIEPV